MLRSPARSAGSKPRQPSGAGVRLVGPGAGIADAGASVHLRRAIQALLILVLAFLAARLAWQLLTPVGPFGASPAIATVTGAADPGLAARAFLQGGHESSPGAAADTSGLALFGVRRASDPRRSTAILGTVGGNQASFAVGDTVAPGVTLASVGDGQVVLDRGGTRLRLALPDAPAPSATAAPAPVASPPPQGPASVSAPIDAGQLLAQAGLRPRLRDGQADGYTLIPRGDGDLLRRAGLQAGDVLLAVNGQALTPERIGEIEQILRTNPNTVVTLERGGERKTLTLQMEPP
jgi:general secretion pathway protein C